ncbi:MAG TPA: 16S rRNA (guanine(527)-N(7))-methyltransferase RsmG [Tepidisphaeraceae bacterium]|jgi:16S rRNA (guanine527-N7)-methyltransferase
MNSLWNDIAGRANVVLGVGQHALLNRYLDLLAAGNQQMNLTRIEDRAMAEVTHIGDALTLLPFLPGDPGISVADVGSGGGVPGIPVAIARPEIKVVLIESTKKKAAFLDRTARELGLGNVRVLAERVEDVGRDRALRESFDVAACRAVATMNWLCEWCLPLVKKGGKLLAMKGPKVSEELPLAEHAIRVLGGGSPDVRPVDLPGTHSHVIVEITKMGRTPLLYPRLATTTRGKPI